MTITGGSRGGGASQISITEVTHVATGQTMKMPTILDSFDYDIKPTFTSTEVYGRMDPIFTYQNTKRSFVAVLKTPKAGQSFTKNQMEALIAGDSQITRLHFDPPIDGNASSFKIRPNAVTPYLENMALLFKMMYPLYAGDMNSNDGTGFMVAAPILRLKLNGITYSGPDAVAQSKGLLFVPETFKISSITRASGVAIEVGNSAALRFAASAGGYVITLGGTILHEENRVGWINANGAITFGQGKNFPYAIDKSPTTGQTAQSAGGSGGSSGTRNNSTAQQTQAQQLQQAIIAAGGTTSGGTP